MTKEMKILNDIIEIIDKLDKENNSKGYPYRFWAILEELKDRINEYKIKNKIK